MKKYDFGGSKLKKVHLYNRTYRFIKCHGIPLKISVCPATICEVCTPNAITDDPSKVTCINCKKER